MSRPTFCHPCEKKLLRLRYVYVPGHIYQPNIPGYPWGIRPNFCQACENLLLEHYYVYVPGNFFRPDMVDYPQLISHHPKFHTPSHPMEPVYPDQNQDQQQDEENNKENLGENLVTTPPKPDEVSQPEVTKPEVQQPEVIKPEVIKPEVSQPEVPQPEDTKIFPPEVQQPEVPTKPQANEPQANKPEAVKPQATKPVQPEAPPTSQPQVSQKTSNTTMADHIRKQAGLPPAIQKTEKKKKNIPLDMNYSHYEDEYQDIRDAFGEGLEDWAETAVEQAKARAHDRTRNDGLCQLCHKVPPTYANQQYCKPCFNSMPYCTQNCGYRTNQKNGLCSHCYNDMKVLCSCCATRYTVYDSGICPQCYWEQKKSKQEQHDEYNQNTQNTQQNYSNSNNKSYPEKQCANEWSERGKVTKCHNKTTYKYCKSCYNDMQANMVVW
jgi:hypothetical protein